MRTNFVGRSWVSAIPHAPASGPFGPVTAPAMSAAPMGTVWAARGHAGRFAARPTIITWTNQRRIVFISPSSYVLDTCPPENPCPPQGHHPYPPHRDSSSPPVPLSRFVVLTPCPPPSIRRPHPLSPSLDSSSSPPVPSPHTRRGGTMNGRRGARPRSSFPRSPSPEARGGQGVRTRREG